MMKIDNDDDSIVRWFFLHKLTIKTTNNEGIIMFYVCADEDFLLSYFKMVFFMLYAINTVFCL